MRRGVANSFLMAASSSLMMRLDARARAQDVEIIGDLGGELVELGLDLVAAERGEPLQAQIEDGLGLLGRELAWCRLGDTLWRGSSISVTMAATSCAGQSRSINCSRASLASFERRG